MAAPLREGFHELGRKWRRLWLRIALWRGERALARAEAELGSLGWQQVDFFDLEITSETRRLAELERSEAALINISAELSAQMAGLEEELAGHRERHEEAMRVLVAESEPLAAKIAELEAGERQKRETVERFERAMAELSERRKELEARQHKLVTGGQTIDSRAEALGVGKELARLPQELKLVLADKARALLQADGLESEKDENRAWLKKLNEQMAAERNRFSEIERNLGGQIRDLTGQRKKSDASMSHLDTEKSKPYRAIGACLADHNLAPMNQPEKLGDVLRLRARQSASADELAQLKQASAAASAAVLRRFYVMAACALGTIIFVVWLLGR